MTQETVHRHLLLTWEPLETREWWQVRPPHAPPAAQSKADLKGVF